MDLALGGVGPTLPGVCPASWVIQGYGLVGVWKELGGSNLIFGDWLGSVLTSEALGLAGSLVSEVSWLASEASWLLSN